MSILLSGNTPVYQDQSGGRFIVGSEFVTKHSYFPGGLDPEAYLVAGNSDDLDGD
jgi:hypothetical protein